MLTQRCAIGVVLLAAALAIAIGRKEAAKLTKDADPKLKRLVWEAGRPTQGAASAKVAERFPKPPPIADPSVGGLVREARAARKCSDIATAVVKIDQAERGAPDEPNVLYEKALIYEEMIPYDKRLKEQAVDTYQAIFDLGKSKAGSLYDIAAVKLADGI